MTDKTFADLDARGPLQDTDIIAIYPTGGPLQRSTNSGLLTYLAATFLRLDGADAMADPLKLPDGLVGTPSLTFANSPTTGLWSPGSGTVALSVGGIEVLRSTSSGATASKKLTLATTASALPPLNLPSGSADVSSPVQGDIWNNADAISYEASDGQRGIGLLKTESWTPAIAFNSGSSTIVYSSRTGTSLELSSPVGNLCYADFEIVTSTFTFSGASAPVTISGLPKAPLSGHVTLPTGSFGRGNAGITTSERPYLAFSGSGSVLTLLTWTGGFVGPSNFSSGTNITLSGSILYRF